jgi:hypothetical protein
MDELEQIKNLMIKSRFANLYNHYIFTEEQKKELSVFGVDFCYSIKTVGKFIFEYDKEDLSEEVARDVEIISKELMKVFNLVLSRPDMEFYMTGKTSIDSGMN